MSACSQLHASDIGQASASAEDDTMSKDSHAHMDIELVGNRLRTLSWMIRCVANDPSISPPKGVDVLDAIDLTMDALDNQADQLDELAERARRHLRRFEPLPQVPASALRPRAC